MSTLPTSAAQVQVQSNWTFTQGLLLGQASFVVLCLLFVRYVVFQPAEDVDQEEWKRRREERRTRTLLSTNVVPPPLPAQILGKTSYEMATHPAESTDWLNVLFAQGYRNDLLSHGGEEGARQKIERWLNPENGKLSWIDPIQVTALSLGSSYPLLSNARVRPSDGQGHIRAEIDIDYLDSASLSLSTSLLINFPRPRFAVLPVSLGVELASIGGTLSVQIHDPAVDERQQMHVCLLPDFHLNLKTTTLLGSRAKLQDIPKLEQLILTRLRSIIQDRLVHPNHLTLTLPRLQSSSPAPPIVADLGQSAVEAVRDGLVKAASDFIHIDSADFPHQSSVEPLLTPSTSTPSSPPASRKSIPMPAGFPTPTPGDRRAGLPAQLPAFAQRPSQASIAHSSARTPLPQTPRAGAAPAISESQQSNSQFRFRGQFASQPPTPGFGHNGLSHEEQQHHRRLGALNSRAL